MGDAHGGVRGVDALAAGAARAVDVDAQVLLLDVDLDVVCLRQDGDGSRGGLDAALALGLGDALDAVHARLELHRAVDLVSQHLELDLGKAALVGGVGVDDLDLPLLALCVAAVHLEEVACEDGGLVAAGGRADLDDDVLLVVGVRRQEHELDLLLEGGQLGLDLGDLLLRELLEVRVGLVLQHVLGIGQLVAETHVLAGVLDELPLVGMLLGELGVLLHIGHDSRVSQLGLQGLVGLDDLGELVVHALCSSLLCVITQGLIMPRCAGMRERALGSKRACFGARNAGT